MTISKRNFATKQPPPLADGDVVDRCNLAQAVAGTVLGNAAGRRITFRGCNLVNVAIDPAWTVEGCNTTQLDFCAWLHPDLALEVEPENCRHVVDVTEVTIDGEPAVTEYVREDKVLQ